jgi:hypothetical protein
MCRSVIQVKCFRRFPLAVVLGAAVLFLNGLRHQGDHLLDVGMDDHRGEHLMPVGHRPVFVLLHLARRAMNLLRREVPGAVQRRQVGTVVVRERFQGLAALQPAKHVAKDRPQVLGVQRVEDLPHLRVARDSPYA